MILTGVPGAGKTSLFQVEFAGTYTRISLDVLKSREKERNLMRSCLANQRPFVVDDTNVRRIDRAAFMGEAMAAGYRVAGYYFRLPLRAAIKRNSLRDQKEVVPVPALIRSFKQLEPPLLGEGF